MNDIWVTIITAFATALVTAAFTFLGYWRKAKADLEKEYASRFNERKWEVYTGFADILHHVFQSAKTGRTNRDLPKHTRKLEEFTSQLWIVGSDEVVEAFNEWLRECRRAEEEIDSTESLIKVSKVLIEMRKDLGYKSSRISPKDVLTTFVKDIEEHI